MTSASPHALSSEFFQLALESGVLRFGQFKTKAGRESPYFFNAGLFDDGAKLGRLAKFYAVRLIESGLQFDMLFGPAYKGIPLAAAVAIELARRGHNKPFAYNRKEAKDHGEGGQMVGAPLAGRVLIIDDVVSAGTSVRESIRMITAGGAQPCGVVIALDRQERANDGSSDMKDSAIQFVQKELGLTVVSIADLTGLLEYLRSNGSPEVNVHYDRVMAYRRLYGIGD